MKQKQDPDQQQVLDIFDLLVDDTVDQLSDYLSISVSNDGDGTKISIETIEAQPTLYTTTFEGIFAPDLKSLLGSHLPEDLLNGKDIPE